MAKSSKVFSVMSKVSAIAAATVVKKVLDKAWVSATGRKPPQNPADPDVQVWEAVSWAIATGATVSLVRMLAQRRAARYYVKSTGDLPPQLAKDGR
jgi:hypothetical protein